MKKKLIIIAILVLCLSVITLVFIKIKLNKKNNLTEEIKFTYDDKKVIESTEEKKIELNEIEVTSIDMEKYVDQIKVKVSIKNNSKEKIYGFIIQINLLDENKKVVTTILNNSKEIIEPNKTIEFESFASGIDNIEQIKSVKIKSLEKGFVQNKINEELEDLTSEED